MVKYYIVFEKTRKKYGDTRGGERTNQLSVVSSQKLWSELSRIRSSSFRILIKSLCTRDSKLLSQKFVVVRDVERTSKCERLYGKPVFHFGTDEIQVYLCQGLHIRCNLYMFDTMLTYKSHVTYKLTFCYILLMHLF